MVNLLFAHTNKQQIMSQQSPWYLPYLTGPWSRNFSIYQSEVCFYLRWMLIVECSFKCNAMQHSLPRSNIFYMAVCLRHLVSHFFLFYAQNRTKDNLYLNNKWHSHFVVYSSIYITHHDYVQVAITVIPICPSLNTKWESRLQRHINTK